MGNVTSLHKAADALDISDLRVQVQKHPSDIDAQESKNGWTPLHVAAHKGFEAGVRELLTRGSDPGKQDKEGRTALHLAAEGGFAQVVQDLLRRGASRTVKDKAGRLPYDYAVQRHPTVAALLACAPQQPPLTTMPSMKSCTSGMPPLDVPSAVSANVLLPPPPPARPPLERSSPIQQGIACPSFPRPHPEQVPVQPLLPPPPLPAPQAPPPRQAALHPAAPAGYDTRAYGTTLSPPTPPPSRPAAGGPLPYPQVPGGERRPPGGAPAAEPRAPLPYPPQSPPPPVPQQQPPPQQLIHGFSSEPHPQPEPSAPPVRRPSADAAGGGADGGWGAAAATGGPATTGATEPTRGSAPTTDLDWGPAPRGDWGDEPESPPRPPQPRPNFNPIMSARIQFEKLLGAGLSHLALLASGGGGGGGGGGSPAGGRGGASAGGGTQSASASGGGGGGGRIGEPLGREASAASALSAESSVMSIVSPHSRTYSYERLREATGNFSPLQKLGEGGYGPVYRGYLDGIPVAVKVMDTSEGAMQGRGEFEAEVNILTSLHHPHVVLLIGSCPEKGILVYELMPNGSLESHLFGRGGASGGGAASAAAGRALPWQDRVRIAAEVASALLFLHSAPTPIVHMDLKPANILLDTHLTAKLGDVGLARLAPTLAQPAGPAAAAVQGGGISTVMDSRLVGTFEYMDPEYMQTAQYSPRSDVYALGMVMLQMLTGQEGKQVIPLVDAERRDPLRFGPCIDPRAGGWPLAEAVAFADLALRCVAYSRQDRPDLRTVILPTLMQLKQRTMLYEPAPGPHPRDAQQPQQQDNVPPMFLCPITQDVMEEPVVAADGYTYEKLAITEWMMRSRTSPLTNLPLAHTNLVENRVLRSAISEWTEQKQKQQHKQQQYQGRQAPPPPPPPPRPPPPPQQQQWPSASAAAPAVVAPASAPPRPAEDFGGW